MMFGNPLRRGIPSGIMMNWLRMAGDRFVRVDGCEVNRNTIDARRVWIAMVPGFSGGTRTSWQGLQLDGQVTEFTRFEDAIVAVEAYLDQHS